MCVCVCFRVFVFLVCSSVSTGSFDHACGHFSFLNFTRCMWNANEFGVGLMAYALLVHTVNCIVGMCLLPNLNGSYFREDPADWLLLCWHHHRLWGAISLPGFVCDSCSVCDVPVYSTHSNTGLILYGTMKEHMDEVTKVLCASLHIENHFIGSLVRPEWEEIFFRGTWIKR